MDDYIEAILKEHKDERLAETLADAACEFLSIAKFAKEDVPRSWKMFVEEYDIKEDMLKLFED